MPNEKDIPDGTDQVASPSPQAKDENNTPQSSQLGEKVEEFTIPYNPDEYGFRRIVRNFAPSYV
jgi:hypothetical protein